MLSVIKCRLGLRYIPFGHYMARVVVVKPTHIYTALTLNKHPQNSFRDMNCDGKWICE